MLRAHPAPLRFPSRTAVNDDPAPPLGTPPPQGLQPVWLVHEAAQLRQVLTNPAVFSNRPYALLGGGGFMLAQDPSLPPDWHAEQRRVAQALFHALPGQALQQLAQLAIEQAAITELRGRQVDLVRFAEQVALRWLALLFGLPMRDHPLLETACRACYRGLQYLNWGRHGATEPATLPEATRGLGLLQQRCAQLLDDYASRHHAPLVGRGPGDPLIHRLDLPDEVLDRGAQGLSGLGAPLLQQLALLPSGLSGGERATVAAGLMAGTVGNVATSVATAYQALRGRRWLPTERTEMQRLLAEALSQRPPVALLPRRTLKAATVGGATLAPDMDVLLLMDGLHTEASGHCPHAFGEPGAHACVGAGLALPLVQAITWHLLSDCELGDALDAASGEPLEPERLWGFGHLSWPLLQPADARRQQASLNVAMRLRSPVSDSAARLRELIRAGAPRIEQVLKDSRHVHFAWFELYEPEGLLLLHTVYDGDFDAYIQHFALQVADVFDRLFEHLEGAPPRPVAEHPEAFVETIRRFNRPPLAGYFFSAYPHKPTAVIV